MTARDNPRDNRPHWLRRRRRLKRTRAHHTHLYSCNDSMIVSQVVVPHVLLPTPVVGCSIARKASATRANHTAARRTSLRTIEPITERSKPCRDSNTITPRQRNKTTIKKRDVSGGMELRKFLSDAGVSSYISLPAQCVAGGVQLLQVRERCNNPITP